MLLPSDKMGLDRPSDDPGPCVVDNILISDAVSLASSYWGTSDMGVLSGGGSSRAEGMLVAESK